MSSYMCPDCGERVDEDNTETGRCNYCHNGKYMYGDIQMAYNGWTNRETWLVNLWYNPESIEDVDVIRDILEEEYKDIEGIWADMINFNAVDWTQLKQHFQTEEEIEAEFENHLRAIRGE